MTSHVVSSGLTSSGLTINANDTLEVLSGGMAEQSTIGSGGQESVQAGGLDDGSTIEGGGVQYDYGTASGTILLGEEGQTAAQIIGSGGIATSTVIGSGGFQEVTFGGNSFSASISAGGDMNILSGGIATSVNVSGLGAAIVDLGSLDGLLALSGATIIVESGGVEASGTLLGSSHEYVLSGGLSVGTTISAGGTLFIELGGSGMSDTVVGSDAALVDWGTVSGAVVTDAFLEVASGGTAIGATVAAGGHEQVDLFAADYYASVSGFAALLQVAGTETSATVGLGGTESVTIGVAYDTVASGGMDGDGDTVSASVTVLSGGLASGVTLQDFAGLQVMHGGRADALTMIGDDTTADIMSGGILEQAVVSGGILTVEQGGQATDVSVLAAAGFVDAGRVDLVSGNVIAAGTIEAGGTLNIGSGAAVGGGIVLDGTLFITSGAIFGAPNVPVTLAGSGGTIDLLSGGSLQGGLTANSTVIVGSGAIISNGTLAGGAMGILAGGETEDSLLIGETIQVDTYGAFGGNLLGEGSVLHVASGGETAFTTVGADAEMYLAGGAIAYGVAVLSGGTLTVDAGASVIQLLAPFPEAPAGGTVLDYGTITLDSNSFVAEITVETGAMLVVDPSGVLSGASPDSIVNSGTIELTSGATLSDTALAGHGGTLLVTSGAQLSGYIETYGSIVFDGADQGPVFIHSAYVLVESGATVSGASFDGDTYVSALSGGTVTDAQMLSGFIEVDSGGEDLGATFASGAYLQMSGGLDSGSTYTFSSYLYASGGEVSNDTFYGSGFISDSAELDGALVGSGGELSVFDGAAGNGVEDRGSASVYSGGTGSGWTVDQGGELFLSGGSLSDVDVQSGTFYISGGSASIISTEGDTTDAAIVLDTPNIMLNIRDYLAPLATISGFVSAGQTLELSALGGLISPTDYTIGDNDEVTFNSIDGSMTLRIAGADEGMAFRIIDGGDNGLYVIDAALSPGDVGLDPVSDSGALGDNLTNDATPNLVGTGTAGDTITIYNGVVIIGTGIVAGDGIWSIGLATPLADGTHTVQVVQSQAGTNHSNPALYSFTIDTSLPATPSSLALTSATDTGVVGDNITADASPTLAGTGQAGDLIEVFAGITVIGEATVGNDGTWQAALNPLADGTYVLHVKAISPADNSSATATVSVTIDATPPLAPTVDLTSATDTGTLGDGITADPAPVLAGVGTVGTVIRVIDTATNAVLGSTTVPPGGGWSIGLPSLANGTYAFNVISTDAAGLASGTPYSLTIDTGTVAAPTLGQSALLTATARPELEGTATPGSTVIIYDGQDALGSVIVGSAGTYVFTPSTALAIGSNPLTAVASNGGGTSSGASAVFMVIVSGDGSYTTQTAPDVNGTTVVTNYSAGGVYTSIKTYSSDHLLLQNISQDVVLRNIFDSAGTLIGTVTEPGSLDGTVNPGFQSVRQALAATTSTDTGASVISLLGETNTLHLDGNDTVHAGSGTALIITAAGDVQVQGGSGSLTFFGGSGTALIAGGSAAIVAVTGSGGGEITGSAAGGNLLAAGGGNSTLNGAGSNDTLFGGNSGSTVINGGSGHDIFVAGAGAVTMHGGSMSSLFFGGSGSSLIEAGPAAHDVVVAGSGHSTIDLSGGDAAFASLGHATIFGSAFGNDSMVGGGDGTEMIGGAGNTVFVGVQGNSTVFGGMGNDTVFTGNGSMEAVLGNGTDHVITGNGNAVVFAGLGSDLFSVFAGHAGGTAEIYGFNTATDHLQLSGYDAADIHEAVAGGNTVLTLSDNTQIVLQGITSLSASSFI